MNFTTAIKPVLAFLAGLVLALCAGFLLLGCSAEVDSDGDAEPETYEVIAAVSLRSGEAKGVHVYCRERTDRIVDAACSVAPNPTRVKLDYDGPNDTLGGEPVGVAWFCIGHAPEQPGGPHVSGGRIRVQATCEVGGRPEGYEVQP